MSIQDTVTVVGCASAALHAVGAILKHLVSRSRDTLEAKGREGEHSQAMANLATDALESAAATLQEILDRERAAALDQLSKSVDLFLTNFGKVFSVSTIAT